MFLATHDADDLNGRISITAILYLDIFCPARLLLTKCQRCSVALKKKKKPFDDTLFNLNNKKNVFVVSKKTNMTTEANRYSV